MGICDEIMLLITGSCGLCYRKAAYRPFVERGRVHLLTAVITNAGASGVVVRAGLEGYVCEFTTSSLVAWVLGTALSPHRECGALEVYSCDGRRKQQGDTLGVEVESFALVY